MHFYTHLPAGTISPTVRIPSMLSYFVPWYAWCQVSVTLRTLARGGKLCKITNYSKNSWFTSCCKGNWVKLSPWLSTFSVFENVWRNNFEKTSEWKTTLKRIGLCERQNSQYASYVLGCVYACTNQYWKWEWKEILFEGTDC